MNHHNEPEHICSSDCPDYDKFTLIIYKSMDDTPLLAKEWYFMFNGILFGLEIEVESEHITVPINNARLLAKIITKLDTELSSDFHISEYVFNSRNNSLRVVLGEH